MILRRLFITAGFAITFFGVYLLATSRQPNWSNEFQPPIPSVPPIYQGTISIGGKGGLSWSTDCESEYRRQYKIAWSECRRVFYYDSKLFNEPDSDYPWLWATDCPGGVEDALKHGWTKCRQQILELQKQMVDRDIRSHMTSINYFPLYLIGIGIVLSVGSAIIISNSKNVG